MISLPANEYLLTRLHQDVSSILSQLATVHQLFEKKVELDQRIREDPGELAAFGPIRANVREQLLRKPDEFSFVVSRLFDYLPTDAVTRAREILVEFTRVYQAAEKLYRSGTASEDELWSLTVEYERLPAMLGEFLHDLRSLQEKISNKLENPPASESPVQAAIECDHVFMKKGDMWQIRYGSEERFLKDCDGLAYIHYLLSRPRRPIPAEELYWAVKGSGVSGASVREGEHVKHELDEERMESGPRKIRGKLGVKADQVHDEESIASYIKSNQYIDTQLISLQYDFANEKAGGRRQELSEQFDRLVREKAFISKSVAESGSGSHYPGKQFPNEAGRKRRNVSMAIHRTYNYFLEDLRDLHDYFSISIHVGEQLAFMPRGSEVWETTSLPQGAAKQGGSRRKSTSSHKRGSQ